MKKFHLTSKFRGYSNKADITNIDPAFLVPPSQNVIINDQEKISTRGGYTLDGSAGSSGLPVVSSYDWVTSTGVERNLRTNGTKIYYRYVDSTGAVTWRDLGVTIVAGTTINFTEWWSSSEALDELLFVDKTSNMNMWSGGVTTLASATSNTITKQGTSTWAESRFLKSGTRSVIIDGVSATYTGGEGTTTLTGVSVDFSAKASGTIVHQAVRVTANTPASGITTDIIGTLNNYVYVADSSLRTVYVSKNTDYTDYNFTSPVRVPGDGAILTLDAPPVAFVPQEEDMYISAQKDQWYRTVFTLSADLTGEDLKVKRLKSGPGQGALSQSSVAQIKNAVLYITNDKTVDTLGRIENINTPSSVPISDIVKIEFQDYDYTINPHSKYFKNKTYIMVPSESKLMIYDHEKALWNPPQIVPGQRLAIIDDELYLHSSQTDETYKLFDGTNDNSNPIDWKMYFAYNNFGVRSWAKEFNEQYTEGYISTNTIATMVMKYDFGGFTSIVNKTIDGSDPRILFATSTDNSLGKNPLGQQPLGSITDSIDNLAKFRVIHNVVKQDNFELQVGYEGSNTDDQFQLLAQGPNALESDQDNIQIKI